MSECVLSHFIHVRHVATVWTARLLCSWVSLGKNTGVGCRALLQGIFLTQGANSGPLYCRRILYHMSKELITLYSYGKANTGDYTKEGKTKEANKNQSNVGDH